MKISLSIPKLSKCSRGLRPTLSSELYQYIEDTIYLSVLVAQTYASYESQSGLSNYTFPEDFMLGVSTSAFQIEGGWNEDGKGESMWDTYLHNHRNFTADGSNGDIAADSYHKWREDIKMIKDLGLNYYRMSISWPRILPNGTDDTINEEGVKYYRQLFEELKKANVSVLVTMFHWDLPTPLMDLGGWANPKIIDYFEDYARVAFTLFGDIVKMWITLNEPHQQCTLGYGNTHYVPALNSHGIGEYLCTHYMLLGHARVYHLYDKEFRPQQNGKIGITLDANYAEPKDNTKDENIDSVETYLQMHFGIYAHPIYSKAGDYPELVRERVDNMSIHQGYTRSRLPYFKPEEIQDIRGSSDFFGLNHYTTFLMSPSSYESTWSVPSIDHDTGVKSEQNPDWPTPGATWLQVYPEGFRKILNWITQQYGKDIPIIVTENGMCDFGGLLDYDRVDYYNKYMYQLLLAIHEDGCNIQGYFAWTLMDDFEWTDGYVNRFGIYQVDFSSPNRTRTPKLSAHNFKEIVKTRTINFDFIKKPSNSSDTLNT